MLAILEQLAISMATKAAAIARELKSIKSDLCFMQERCTLLEEENRRLRDGFVKGIRPEEDDLVSFFSLLNPKFALEFDRGYLYSWIGSQIVSSFFVDFNIQLM